MMYMESSSQFCYLCILSQLLQKSNEAAVHNDGYAGTETKGPHIDERRREQRRVAEPASPGKLRRCVMV